MESQEEKKTEKTWLKPVVIVLGVVLILVVLAVVMLYVERGTHEPTTESYAKSEMSSLQTALLCGMGEVNADSVIAGTISPYDNTKTVYYLGKVWSDGSQQNGSFQLETYLHLPTTGEWHWTTDCMIDKGCYEGGGECCAYSEGNWTCTKHRSCSNCACS